MYKTGDLLFIEPPCDTMDGDWCDGFDEEGVPHRHVLSDARGKAKIGTGNVYLPHSCDEWIIGGKAEIEAMIKDLQAALIILKETK